jgi:Fe/S biogenesis protein NfuA
MSETETTESTPSVTFTDAAVAKLNDVIKDHGSPVLGLRLQIVGRAHGQFQHVLSLVEEGAPVEADLQTEAAGFDVYLERQSAPYLDNVEVHYEFKGPNQSGLEFRNPNPLWRDEREMQIQDLFDQHINPAIASHGGWVNLLGVEGTTAYVELGGGCQGCGMADVTLKQGIAATIVEEVEGIEEVVDRTDHASGENPYYQPSKK